jgi:hypothetical protein
MMTTRHPSEDLHRRIYTRLQEVVPDLLTIEEHGNCQRRSDFVANWPV